MKAKNILAIDDESTCLEVITFALESHGYNVFTADNGKSGIDFLLSSKEKIDLILLDMMLPDMYGLEALETIKNMHSAKNIPVIMQTGTSNYEDLKKAVKLGATSEIIHKPYCRADLIQVVEVALEKSKMSKSKQTSITL